MPPEQNPLPPPEQNSIVIESTSPSKLLKSILLVLLIILLGGVFYWWQFVRESTNNSEAIAGADIDNDGVWDYIQEYIDQTYSADLKIHSALNQYAKAHQNFILSADADDQTLFSIVSTMDRAQDCLNYVDKDPMQVLKIQQDLRAHILNTKARSRAYAKADDRLSGKFWPTPDRTKGSCDFDPDTLLTSLDTSTWQTYRNEKYGFEIRYPNDWVLTEKFSNADGFFITKGISILEILPQGEFDHGINVENSTRSEEKLSNRTVMVTTVQGEIPFSYQFTDATTPKTWKRCLPDLKNCNRIDLFAGTQESIYIFDKILSTFKFIELGVATTGTLTGKVTIGPNCPVEQAGNPCSTPPEAYTAREFLVLNSNQKQVASFHADSGGNFNLALPPGTYTITSAKTGIGFMSKDLPKTITIKPGQTITFNIDIDTGIR